MPAREIIASNSRQLRIRPGHGRFGDLKRREKRGRRKARLDNSRFSIPPPWRIEEIGCAADRRGFTLRLRLDAAAVSGDENLRDHDEGLFLRG